MPKLVLTTPSTLSYGYARALFLDFARNPANLVLLPGLSEPGSLARWLVKEMWEPAQDPGCRYGEGKVGKEVKMDKVVELEVRYQSLAHSRSADMQLDRAYAIMRLQMKRKVYLEGDELEAHLEAEREAAERLAKQQAALERTRRMLADAAGDSDSDSDAEDEDEEADAADEAGHANGEDVVGPTRRRRIGGFTGGAGAWDEFLDADALAGSAGGQSFDIYVRGSYGLRSGGGGGGLQRFRMFPVVERRRRVDAYGEAIDVEGWLKRGQEDDPLMPGGDKQILGKRPREDEPEPQPEVRVSDSVQS